MPSCLRPELNSHQANSPTRTYAPRAGHFTGECYSICSLITKIRNPLQRPTRGGKYDYHFLESHFTRGRLSPFCAIASAQDLGAGFSRQAPFFQRNHTRVANPTHVLLDSSGRTYVTCSTGADFLHYQMTDALTVSSSSRSTSQLSLARSFKL